LANNIYIDLVTNVLNSLSFSVVTAPSVNSFTNRLHNHWVKNLDTIGKQNCQALEAEAELNFEFYHYIFQK